MAHAAVLAGTRFGAMAASRPRPDRGAPNAPVGSRVWGLTFVYGLPPKYKKLIDVFGKRDKPAVVYPASGVGSDVVRADMESASLSRQSLQAAGVQLPEM
jgi:hypothetical protein